MDAPAVLFLLTCYYNEQEVCDFVRKQLLPLHNASMKVIVVNNGTRRLDLLQDLVKTYSFVELTGDGTNLGYFGAAGKAYSFYKEHHTVHPAWTIVCNTDIEFLSPEIFRKLNELKPGCDIVGPSIHSSVSGKELNPFALTRLTKEKLNFLLLVYSFYSFYLVYQLLAILKAKVKASSGTPAAAAEVYAIHGSCMIFRDSFFERGGHFEFGGFLFGEELFVAEEALKKHLKTFFIPGIKVVHREHSTTGWFKKPVHIRWMKDSLKWLLKSYYHD